MSMKVFQLVIILTFLLCLKTCDDGTYADASGACRQCDISCNTCRSSDGCSTCYDQMYLVARGNLLVCDLCYNVNKGCDICLTGTKCQNCSSGYFLQADNRCSNCNTLMPHCLLCQTGNDTYCVSCENPYQLIDGICTLNSSNPSSGSSSNLPNTQTQTQTIQPQSQPTTSQQVVTPACDPSQININGVCYPTIAFCESYNQTDGSCLSCSSSIFTLVSGYCLPASLVLANTQSSQLSASTAISTATPTPTPIASEQSSSTIFVPCTNRQYYNHGVCVDVGPQCKQFDSSTGACYICEQGFQAYNGLCVQLPAASQSSSSNLSTNGVITLPTLNTLPNCQLVNPIDPTMCLSCNPGYAIVDEFPGVCYQIN